MSWNTGGLNYGSGFQGGFQGGQFGLPNTMGGPRCRNGHPLGPTTFLPPPYIRNAYKCDGCGIQGIAGPNMPCWHCSSCTYDLCQNCGSRFGGGFAGNTGFNTGINTGINTGVNPLITTGLNAGIYSGLNSGMGTQGFNSGFNPGMTGGGIRCRMGHQLQPITQLPLNIYATGNYRCDRCGVVQVPNMNAQVWHCGMCNYDICPNCSRV